MKSGDGPTDEPGRDQILSWLGKRVDWQRHPLGPMSQWPNALVQILSVIRTVRYPVVVAWGPRRIMFYNAAYAPILSDKPDALGQPLDEVFSESWDVVGAIFDRAMAGESVFLEDVEIPITREGKTSPSWWTLSYSPIPLAEDVVGGVLCIVSETTRAQLAEARETAVQSDLTRITDLVPGLLWRADSFGRTVWVSGRLKALSAANDANASTLWRRLVHPEDLASVLAELSAAKTQRRPFVMTFRLKVLPDVYHWHQARSEPAFGEDGAVTGWFGVATDVQTLRDATDTLKDREALFSQFSTNSANLLWTVDLETLEIERLSANFGEIWPVLKNPGKWFWPEFLAAVHEADRPAIEVSFARVCQGEVANEQFRIVTPGGDIRIMDGTIFPIVSADGRIPCLGGIFRDVTPELKRAAHLIDADPASQNRLAHALRKQGFEVKTFDSIAAFAQVAAALKPGPILYRHRGDGDDLRRLSGLIRSALTGRPWVVIHDCNLPAREAVEIMKLGACDVLEADAAIEMVAAALTTATSLIGKVAGVEKSVNSEVYRLTAREQQILNGIVAGGTNKSIALTLGLSPRTVETHRGHIMERLAVKSLAEMVALATSPNFRSIST